MMRPLKFPCTKRLTQDVKNSGAEATTHHSTASIAPAKAGLAE